MQIQAVLFDLGNTLMHAVDPDGWPQVLQQGNQALMDFLCEDGLDIDCGNFAAEFNHRLRKYYIEREKLMLETSTFSVLKELLAEKGFANVTDDLLRGALDQHYAVTQQNWQLEDDTLTCLDSLKKGFIKLGLLSNAGDDRDVAQLVDKFNLRSYFEFVLTSAACGYRKPHKRIFELAMENLNIPPEHIAVVGDKLDADILGANQVGMYSIWIDRRAELPSTLEQPVQPDAIINTLLELPSLILEK
jgi:HAD superfamily hydrolase (TIGR01662 family)